MKAWLALASNLAGKIRQAPEALPLNADSLICAANDEQAICAVREQLSPRALRRAPDAHPAFSR